MWKRSCKLILDRIGDVCEIFRRLRRRSQSRCVVFVIGDLVFVVSLVLKIRIGARYQRIDEL